MTTTKTPAAPTVDAVSVLNTLGTKLDELKGSTIASELALMEPASAVLAPMYQGMDATYRLTAKDATKAMPTSKLYERLLQDAKGKLNPRITPAVVRELAIIVPLHSAARYATFAAIVSTAAEARIHAIDVDKVPAKDAPKAVPLTIAAYFQHLPRIALGWWDADGALTDVGTAGMAAADDAADAAQVKRVNERVSESPKSEHRGAISTAVAAQSTARGESALVAARRIAYDALTVLAQAERDATDAEREAAEKLIKLAAIKLP